MGTATLLLTLPLPYLLYVLYGRQLVGSLLHLTAQVTATLASHI